MKSLGPPADVIIADGSSTDGALAGDLVGEYGIRALLVMRGPGGQSAQLRLAFAYAMRQGYDGIIQVDGNNKDGVEAIPSFVDALNAGADYVQGNRFGTGGEQVNTPLVRLVAIRTVHEAGHPPHERHGGCKF